MKYEILIHIKMYIILIYFTHFCFLIRFFSINVFLRNWYYLQYNNSNYNMGLAIKSKIYYQIIHFYESILYANTKYLVGLECQVQEVSVYKFV